MAAFNNTELRFATGLEELRETLDVVREEQKADPQADLAILFKLGDATSIVVLGKDDKVYYNNIDGRAAPLNVRRAVAEFELEISRKESLQQVKKEVERQAANKKAVNKELIEKVAQKAYVRNSLFGPSSQPSTPSQANVDTKEEAPKTPRPGSSGNTGE